MAKRFIPLIVLASGGIDSTALIYYYLRLKQPVKALHFDYGQRTARSEAEAVKSICEYYGIGLKKIKLGFRLHRRNYEFLGRNTIFVITAASIGPPPVRIGIGINRGPEYYDITQTFVEDCQKILDGYFGGTVTIEAPFVDYSKLEIINFSKKRRIPLSLTFSCQEKNAPPCGKCPSCMDRKKYGVF